VRGHGHRCSLGNVLRKIEKSISFMVFADLNEVVGSGIGEKINPFFGIPRVRREILNEIIICKFCSVSLLLIVVYISLVTRTFAEPPPIPKRC
jgi:hypothetical protein